MKILIDTNILIGLEDDKVVEKPFANFYRLAIGNSCKILYHPKAVPQDLSRDKNSERQKIVKSKLNKYESLVDFAIPDENFSSYFRNSKINDELDNVQLFQVKKNYVDFFITQDKRIHKNAEKIDIASKVYTIESALAYLESIYTFKIPTHPILKEHSIRDIEDKFDAQFFDSLRNDYGEKEFNSWLKKCSEKNRKCYSLIVKDSLQAILIYNIEEVEDHQLTNVFTKALKICTLKVNDNAFGVKLGELFLNKMFEMCINRGILYLYLTVYEKQGQLIYLLEKFGFYRNTFLNSQGLSEIQMIKCLDRNKVKINSNSIDCHPFYTDNTEISKYVIPIRPQFYNKLFKDGTLRQPTLFDNTVDSVNEIQGNTIIKAYISNSRNQKLKKSDLVFFYSSKINQVIEPVGILESVKIITNFEELWKTVNKKTVFSQETLLEWFSEKEQLHVITFRLITYLNKSIGLKKIKKINSFKNNIQTITELKEIDYIKLKDEGYFDERYIIN